MDQLKGILVFSRLTVIDIQSFMGLTSYYRWFIKRFFKIVMPLIQLTIKDQSFIWMDACEQYFAKLKKRLTTSLVMVLPNLGEPFEVYYDVSH
uniref:Reverse transcriptase/retrotransposon-derived protein RNase H-like domain-containing protein n=1 Tax=Cajanus cajan TaxID=3821 RepID=A0A151U773_CAJCA|nr:hypothetical protein KK1_007768 [Cajanus cajan]